MKSQGLKYFLLISLFGLITGCGSGSDSSPADGGGNNPKGKPVSRIEWASIPAEFNPTIDDMEFSIEGIEKLKVNVFAFNSDVELLYSSSMDANTAMIRSYKVWKKSASWGYLSPDKQDKTLHINGYGSYQCSISTQNNRITELEGGCYIRLQIILPAGKEVEVYNTAELLSRRFIPVSTTDFLEEIDDATWSAEKFQVIENFVNSYEGMSKRPQLTTEQLAKVIDEFMQSAEKFKVLRRLHGFVTDRGQLGQMIEDEFGYFDREEARRIVGI